MTAPHSSHAANEPAQRAAALIQDAFEDYNARFSDITRRARRRFERRDWRLSQADAVARIDLIVMFFSEALGRLENLLDERVRSRPLWRAIRLAYAQRIAALPDRPLYETFFNSLARRFFLIQGVAADIEFLALEIAPGGDASAPGECLRHPAHPGAARLWQAILADRAFANGYADLAGSARAIADTIDARFAAHDDAVTAIELLRTVFYRERRAYLVGRAIGARSKRPLVVALVSTDAGVRADAVLTDRGDVSILFGYARSYFHADLGNIGDAVAYLQTLLPHKPVDEIYTVLGRATHGKTERYRRVFRHLRDHPDERLVRAAGARGMVMSVFTPTACPVVFKLIRDRFAYPKDSVRRQVEEKYDLVFRHDRAGRLIDAQEFHRLRFARAQFAPDMLDELLTDCAETVSLDGDDVVVKHCYVERRVRPLDLHVRESAPDVALRALLDYGQAIKDLARSNIFPGDLLLKNFGVSRNGRALFYDYDELCLVQDCHFRVVPKIHQDDETRPLDDWLYARREDVFPELFPPFLGVPKPLREALQAAHGEIFDAAWWTDTQVRLRNGEYLDVAPYPATTRIAPVASDGSANAQP
ncbi:MAG: bifunctional isocitrate dehydrogenase kinase/phosphatase [Luteimonas sp.]